MNRTEPMRNGRQTDHDPELEPGQIWLVEHSPALDSGSLAGADVVFYDPGLAPVILGLVPSRIYSEPLPEAMAVDAPAISARALKLACEGWRVVQLVRPSPGLRRRLHGAAAELMAPTNRGHISVRPIARTHRPGRGREEGPPGPVAGSAEDELLTLIVGPFATTGPAAACAVAANGLAG